MNSDIEMFNPLSDFQKSLQLIPVNSSIYDINLIDEYEEANKDVPDVSKTDLQSLPEIDPSSISIEIDKGFLSTLENYYTKSRKQYNAVEKIPEKTDLQELKTRKQQDKTVVGFNKLQFDHLSDQLASLPPHSTLEVVSFDFTEPVEVNKPVHIVANPTSTVSVNGEKDCLTCNAFHVVIENFNFIYDGIQPNSAAKILNGDVTFINCRFSCKQAHTIFATNSSNATFINCEFTSATNESQIYVDGNAMVTLQTCKVNSASKNGIVAKNKSSLKVFDTEITMNNQNGVELQDSASALFSNCNISINSLNGLLIKSNSSNIMLVGNEISNHQNGYGTTLDKSKCTFISNKFLNNQKGAIFANSESSIVSEHNEFQVTESTSLTSNPFSKDATHIIKISHKSKGTSREDQFSLCKAENTIVVENNSVFEGIGLNFSQLEGSGVVEYQGSSVTLTDCTFTNFSKFGVGVQDHSKITMTNCRFKNSNNHDSDILYTENTALFVSGENNTTTLTNCHFNQLKFAIKLSKSNGRTEVKDCKLENFSSSALNIESSTNIKFDNTHFLNGYNENPDKNSALVLITGAYLGRQTDPLVNENLRTEFNNCLLRKSSSTNLAVENGGWPLFRKCKFEESLKQCVQLKGGNGSFVDCLFHNNRNAAILIAEQHSLGYIENSECSANILCGVCCQNGGELILKKSKIYENTKQSGIVVRNAKATIEDTEFYHNPMCNIEFKSSKCALKNCNIHSSGSNNYSTGIFGSEVTIDNCNFHDEQNNASIYITDLNQTNPETRTILKQVPSNIEITGSSFSNCLQSAISLGMSHEKKSNSQSSLSIDNCKFFNNAMFGVLAFIGSLNIKNSTFEKNARAPMAIAKNVKKSNY